MEQNKKLPKDKVRFIRKNGKVIPIPVKPGDKAKSPKRNAHGRVKKAGKTLAGQIKKAGPGIKKIEKRRKRVGTGILAGSIAGSVLAAGKGRGRLALGIGVGGIAAGVINNITAKRSKRKEFDKHVSKGAVKEFFSARRKFAGKPKKK